MKVARFTVFLDASVLYPAAIRDILLEIATADLYFARWSNAVHDEWTNALLRDRPDLTAEQLQRTRTLMNRSVRDALVEGFEPLIAGLSLPDPNDRHVLAAATSGHADVIVTANLKYFPADELQKWSIEALHPDAFPQHQFHLNQPDFLRAIRTVLLSIISTRCTSTGCLRGSARLSHLSN